MKLAGRRLAATTPQCCTTSCVLSTFATTNTGSDRPRGARCSKFKVSALLSVYLCNVYRLETRLRVNTILDFLLVRSFKLRQRHTIAAIIVTSCRGERHSRGKHETSSSSLATGGRSLLRKMKTNRWTSSTMQVLEAKTGHESCQLCILVHCFHQRLPPPLPGKEIHGEPHYKGCAFKKGHRSPPPPLPPSFFYLESYGTAATALWHTRTRAIGAGSSD